jgi:hypothetical protein
LLSPSISIKVEPGRFQHFRSKGNLDDIEMDMYLGINHESGNTICAGNFYSVKSSTSRVEASPRNALAYVFMVGKQKCGIRSLLLPKATNAVIKWYNKPEGADVLGDWAQKASKKGKRWSKCLKETDGMAIVAAHDLDPNEMDLSQVFDTPTAAQAWLREAEETATAFFSNPILHDAMLPQLSKRRVQFPRPPYTRGAFVVKETPVKTLKRSTTGSSKVPTLKKSRKNTTPLPAKPQPRSLRPKGSKPVVQYQAQIPPTISPLALQTMVAQLSPMLFTPRAVVEEENSGNSGPSPRERELEQKVKDLMKDSEAAKLVITECGHCSEA